MRDRFPGYYRPTDEDVSQAWASGSFVVDANVLLNLYRYPEEAREALFAALESLGARLWLPHQAALEYQRNRLTVLAEQRRRYSEVEQAATEALESMRKRLSDMQLEKRHSTIDPAPLIDGVANIVQTFTSHLGEQLQHHSDVHEADPIRERIDALFADRVGDPFESQEILTAIYGEGAKRYAAYTPPGYLDQDKDGDESGEFEYAGLSYKRAFGDLILWKQVIDWAQSQSLTSVVLVTDDEKDDWWWRVRSAGKKKVGPRPELVAEITAQSTVQTYLQYSSESFLTLAKQFLNLPVSDASISQVKDVRQAQRTAVRGVDVRRQADTAEAAVVLFLSGQFPGAVVQVQPRGPVDVTVDFPDDGGTSGFDVAYLRDPRFLPMRVRDRVYRLFYEVAQGRLTMASLILVADTIDTAQEALETFARLKLDVPKGVSVWFGYLDRTDEERLPVFRLVGSGASGDHDAV